MAWVLGGADEAFERFSRAIEIADAGGDLFTSVVAGSPACADDAHAPETSTSPRANAYATSSARCSCTTRKGVAYGLEGLCAVAAARGEARRAGALAAAGAIIRRRIGVFDIESFGVHTRYLEALRERDADAVAAGEAEGEELSVRRCHRGSRSPSPSSAPCRKSLRQW